ncbi:MAG: xanthine dehydrogenase accessory protein XdhC [Candidatus Puniceispirillaceae bacterium]
MRGWGEQVQTYLLDGQKVCRIVVAEAKGSTPREAGADMYVTAHQTSGTIGGGTLEFEAMALARQILAEIPENSIGFTRHFRVFALGPNLGQCCGGQVTLLFEGFTPSCLEVLASAYRPSAAGTIHKAERQFQASDICVPAKDKVCAPVYDKNSQTLHMPPEKPLVPFYLYGAGHVGRAVMAAVSGLSLEKIWVDTAASRFPVSADPSVTRVPAADMSVVAAHAPKGAIHIVMSYSHRIDEALVYTILKKGDFAHLGLIGSDTKYRRFCTFLKKQGIGDDQLAQLVCPVGVPVLQSKAPAHVGLSVATQIAYWLEQA